MKSPEETRAQFEEQWEQIVLLVMLRWAGVKELIRAPWRLFQ